MFGVGGSSPAHLAGRAGKESLPLVAATDAAAVKQRGQPLAGLQVPHQPPRHVQALGRRWLLSCPPSAACGGGATPSLPLPARLSGGGAACHLRTGVSGCGFSPVVVCCWSAVLSRRQRTQLQYVLTDPSSRFFTIVSYCQVPKRRDLTAFGN